MYSLSPNTKKEFIPCGLLYPMKPKGLEDAEQALGFQILTDHHKVNGFSLLSLCFLFFSFSFVLLLREGSREPTEMF
jgi:hypothetical protein